MCEVNAALEQHYGYQATVKKKCTLTSQTFWLSEEFPYKNLLKNNLATIKYNNSTWILAFVHVWQNKQVFS